MKIRAAKSGTDPILPRRRRRKRSFPQILLVTTAKRPCNRQCGKAAAIPATTARTNATATRHAFAAAALRTKATARYARTLQIVTVRPVNGRQHNLCANGVTVKNRACRIRHFGYIHDRFHVQFTLTSKPTLTLSPGARSFSGKTAAGS